MIFQPRNLQQRTLLFVLFPTFLLLLVLSVSGLVFVQNILLRQWGETALAKLQRTAHLIDMQLRKPKDLLLLLQSSDDADLNRQTYAYILKQLRELKGVVGVKVQWPPNAFSSDNMSKMMMKPAMGMMHNAHREPFTIGSPTYNSDLDDRTVSLIAKLNDRDKKTVGQVEVIISFDQLIDKILNAPWWKTNKAYLIDGSGNVLASTALHQGLEDSFPVRVFGTVNNLEKETLAAMQKSSSGTVFGSGSPPGEISGFYRLAEAPWTLVIMAPGAKVLEPIIRFRLIYILSFTACILLILVFIRQTTGRVTRRIKEVSAAADDLAKGKFGPPLVVTTRDEVGELVRSFNAMSGQLEHRLAMKEAINIAREVQQNLLPQQGFSAPGVTAAGICLYCDETGGDYFDIIRFPDNDQKVGLVVGDVVGHGIGAALLMTTVRALLRCRLHLPDDPGRTVNDVNRLLCRDTSKSGNFITLFYLEADGLRGTLRWVRCGHDPAIVYTPSINRFSELRGEGLALGVETDWNYEASELTIKGEEQIICIGSDGAWEVENGQGEQFGKERIKQILSARSKLQPGEILQEIVEAIGKFRGETPQNDDITLVLVKIC